MLLTRVLTALIAGPLLVALVVWGPWWGFPAFTALLVTLAAWEHQAMTRAGAPLWSQLLTVFVAGTSSAVWVLTGKAELALMSLSLGTLALMLGHLRLAEDMAAVGPRLSAALAGLLYCVLPLSHLGLLYRLGPGWKLVLLVLVCTFSSDTGAYFTGRALGKHPFAPRVSPKKTWEGAIGGLFFSVLACQLWRGVMPELSAVDATVLGLGAGFLGQLGDLSESLIKRSAGVKDSGRILPGHGGVLDRFDAVAFAAPIVYYYYLLVVQRGWTAWFPQS